MLSYHTDSTNLWSGFKLNWELLGFVPTVALGLIDREVSKARAYSLRYTETASWSQHNDE